MVLQNDQATFEPLDSLVILSEAFIFTIPLCKFLFDDVDAFILSLCHYDLIMKGWFNGDVVQSTLRNDLQVELPHLIAEGVAV